MDGETTIAQGLHVTDDSAGYDAACKRVLSEKAILAQIVNGSDFPLKGNTAVGCPDLRQNNVSHPSAVVKINRAPVVQVGG